MASKIQKKHEGGTVEWLGKDNQVLSGKIVSVKHGIAKIEHGVSGRYETFTTYLSANSDQIVSVAQIIGYTIGSDVILKAARE